MAGRESDDGAELRMDQALKAMVALLADQRESRIANDRDAVRTEVLLADAGLTLKQISSLLGKKYETVKTTVRRGRRK